MRRILTVAMLLAFVAVVFVMMPAVVNTISPPARVAVTATVSVASPPSLRVVATNTYLGVVPTSPPSMDACGVYFDGGGSQINTMAAVSSSGGAESGPPSINTYATLILTNDAVPLTSTGVVTSQNLAVTTERPAASDEGRVVVILPTLSVRTTDLAFTNCVTKNDVQTIIAGTWIPTAALA